MTVLRFESVSKSYRSDFMRRSREVLRGISFEVQTGETFAYLGHNGAGKTTSIKAMLGLIKIDAGTIEVFGRAPGDRHALARVGYVPEKPYFYDHLSGREFLQLVADLHGLRHVTARRRIGEILELVSMRDRADQRMRGYSKGMLQRIGLGQALINDPDLLILDEPMGGLDPLGRHHIRTIVAELKARRKTILMSSHILSDVEAVADRAAILTEGELRRVVDLDDRSQDTRAMEIQCRGLDASRVRTLVDQGLQVEFDNDTARVRVEDRHSLGVAISQVQSTGAYVLQVAPVRMDLERVFLREVASATTDAARSTHLGGGDEETREHVRRILDNLIGASQETDEIPQEVHS